MIATLLAFPRHDLSTCWRRPLNIIMFAVLSLMMLGFVTGGVQVSSGSADTGGAKVSINSAFNLAFTDVAIFALFLPFFVAVAFGMPVLSDADRRFDRLIAATPLSHLQYVLSRFLGSLAVLTAILVAWTGVQVALFEFFPLDANERTRGDFVAWNYLLPLVLFALPLTLLVGGVSTWLGIRSRRPVLVFAFPVAVVVTGLFGVWTFNPEWLPRRVDLAMQWLDPTGLRWFLRTFLNEDRGVSFYNTAALVPDTAFIASRVAVAATGLLAVWAAGRRLAATERRDRRVANPDTLLAEAARTAAMDPSTTLHAAIAARGQPPASTTSLPGFLSTTLHVLRSETGSLLRSPGVWLFGPLILLQTWATTAFRQGPLDTELLMTTGAAAAGAFNTLTLLLCLLILFYTVESLVREQRCGLDAMLRASPAPTAAVLAGKVLANAVMASVIVACAAVAIVIVLAKQSFDTGITIDLEFPTLVLIFGVLLAPTLIVWGSFVAFLHAAIRNRFAVYGVALAVLVATGFATQFDYLNWVTKWHLWSAVQWSELDRLAFMWPAIATNRLLVLALAVFLIVATLRLWPRRTPDLRAVADRFRPGRLIRAAILPLAAAAPVASLVIYAGLEVRHGFEGSPSRDAQKAYWRRNSSTWEGVPVPALDRVDGEVKLHPDTRSLEVAATYVLRNPHRAPMAEVPITVGSHLTTSDWTVDGVACDPESKDQTVPGIENRSGLHVIRPTRPLERNGTVTVSFKLKGEFPKGWSRSRAGAGEFLLPSGVVLTSFSPSFLPMVGFSEGVGVNEDNQRDAKDYPLDHWKARVDPAFGPAWATHVRLAVEGPADWTMNVVGVEKESTTLDGRKRTLWETEHPVRLFNIVGGPLVARHGEGADIFHSSRTPHNVETMTKALAASRQRYASWFGAYPWTNLRVTQFPALAGYAQGFPGNISFSEGIGFLSRPVSREEAEEGNAVDVAFYIVAHEAGHQWWGNILTPGRGPGGNIISEGLAEFSAAMLLHHELGPSQATALRRRWEKQYVEGRRADNERSINRTDGTRPGDQVVTYQRAGLAFWMLRELMGEEAMVAGLRSFVARWKDGVETPDGLDFPLIEDLIADLRPHAPDAAAFDAFVNDWILGKVLPILELETPKVEPGTGGDFTVTTELRNTGTGTAEVVVRVLGEAPKPATDEGGTAATEHPVPPHADVVVRVGPGKSAEVKVPTTFRPARIVVDPEVRLLFSGRKACERSL
ncbi:MAG: M1 family aminopeptidase [Phycisphaerae bacterium]